MRIFIVMRSSLIDLGCGSPLAAFLSLDKAVDWRDEKYIEQEDRGEREDLRIVEVDLDEGENCLGEACIANKEPNCTDYAGEEFYYNDW